MRALSKDLGMDFAGLLCGGVGFHDGPGKGRACCGAKPAAWWSTRWAGFSSATSPCALTAIFPPPRNGAFPRRYETCCHHRRRHHRADRGLLSQAAQRPGPAVRSRRSRGRRDPVRPPRRLSGRIRAQQHPGNIAGHFRAGARIWDWNRAGFIPIRPPRNATSCAAKSRWQCPLPPPVF